MDCPVSSDYHQFGRVTVIPNDQLPLGNVCQESTVADFLPVRDNIPSQALKHVSLPIENVPEPGANGTWLPSPRVDDDGVVMLGKVTLPQDTAVVVEAELSSQHFIVSVAVDIPHRRDVGGVVSVDIMPILVVPKESELIIESENFVSQFDDDVPGDALAPEIGDEKPVMHVVWHVKMSPHVGPGSLEFRQDSTALYLACLPIKRDHLNICHGPLAGCCCVRCKGQGDDFLSAVLIDVVDSHRPGAHGSCGCHLTCFFRVADGAFLVPVLPERLPSQRECADERHFQPPERLEDDNVRAPIPGEVADADVSPV